ncbi:ABC transporter substrate-binding protein [Desulfatibacillum aliphaticivorans]|uniref:ABC transporter substrate-binding protein n=1 Tax=Desulfatibacillum aliphaticivorans TaxID=218208 RepID=B8FI77_DESAL|nr:ABC transporter substrate binding protein [Desulfatibacillum aliphaticivorans]ACL02644.1 conserved hypothetical protein [Desulfatibacillum aliphaticivorans]
MKKLGVYLAAVMTLALILAGSSPAADFTGKKILLVDSYHEGYEWSDGIIRGAKTALDGKGIEVKVFRMDTKRQSGEEYKKSVSLKAKALIDSFKPDVVIASDDNAAKYLVEPYLKNTATPVVFCGVNWDASVYGFPCKNVTGMVEVTPVPQLLEQLKPFAKGDRLGFIGPDTLTSTKEAENISKAFGLSLEKYFSKSAEDWKMGFAELQGKVDILLVDSDGGLYADQADELIAFVEANTKIPTGTSYDFMAPYALLDFAKVSEEQGLWAAEAALKILGGASPDSIAIAQNKEGKLILNARIAQNLGQEIPYTLIEAANQVIQ